jgi:CBS domain-containing protein
MTPDDAGKLVELRVGVRETLMGDGTVHRHLTVQCELRHATTDVHECAGCERCVGVVAAEGERPGLVRCWQPRGAAPVDGPAPPTLVGAVMERDFACVTADVELEAISALLYEWHAAAVPVVDARGLPIGLVSREDLGRGGRAGDAMTPLAFALDEGSELLRAAAVMSGEGFHQLPVCLADGTLAGLLSTCVVARRVTRAAPAVGEGDR